MTIILHNQKQSLALSHSLTLPYAFLRVLYFLTDNKIRQLSWKEKKTHALIMEN